MSIVNPFLNKYDTSGDRRQFELFFIDLNIYWAERAIEFAEKSIEQNNLELERMNEVYRSQSMDSKDEDLSVEILTACTYQRTICRSFIMNQYQILETGMKKICDAYPLMKLKENKDTNDIVTYRDMTDDGYLNKTKSYLTNVIGFNEPPLWHEIKVWREVRNCFVHDDGVPQNPGSENRMERILQLYIQREDFNPDIKELIVDFEDCRKFLSCMRQTLNFYTLDKNKR